MSLLLEKRTFSKRAQAQQRENELDQRANFDTVDK